MIRKEFIGQNGRRLARVNSEVGGGGGVGFKDLSSFNQALAVKQCQRLLQYPDSLVAKVLKARYYKQTDFMEAKVGSNPSFIWRSILCGKEVLQQGIRWRVRRGGQICVMASKWMPRLTTFRPIFAPSLPVNTKVADLIGADHEWKNSLIVKHFTKEEADLIKRIPLPRWPTNDERLWHYDKKEIYIVRSGCQLALKLKYAEVPTSSTGKSNGWHTIWKFNLPGKPEYSFGELPRICCQLQKIYFGEKLCRSQHAKSIKYE